MIETSLFHDLIDDKLENNIEGWSITTFGYSYKDKKRKIDISNIGIKVYEAKKFLGFTYMKYISKWYQDTDALRHKISQKMLRRIL